MSNLIDRQAAIDAVKKTHFVLRLRKNRIARVMWRGVPKLFTVM